MIIGIDPGVNTGMAAWSPASKAFTCIMTVNIIAALYYCQQQKNDCPRLEIWFEDARQRTWFGDAGREQLQGAGSIKRDCQVWGQFCNYHGIFHRAIKPQKGGTKWTAEQFQRLTGWTGRTSTHARDAAMLVYGADYAAR